MCVLMERASLLLLLLVSSLEAATPLLPAPESLGRLQDDFGDVDLSDFGDVDLSDFDLDIAPQRVPRQVKTLLTKETKPHVQELSIKTTIISRYAFTAVYCLMLNRHPTATNAVFQFHIPADAFVSNFTMIIGGRVYQSEVKPKKKRVNKEGGGRGGNKESGGASSEAEVFRMEVSIPGRNRAVFLLTYEELLRRRLGRYHHVTSLRPLQLVSRLRLEINILDHSPITDLEVLPLQNGRSNQGASASKSPAKRPITTVVKQEENTCRITFSPNIVQQAQITTSGVLGDFVVRYDVQREMGIGDIQVLNGHFVHYFAPKDLPVVPKNVVFVIDTSASMVGTKIKQTKEALFTILRDLRPEDHFNFVSFSNRIKVWHPNRLVQATVNNISDAKRFILRLTTNGGTNIDDAIQTGSSLLRDYLSGPDANPNSVSLIIFLTDGKPTVGEKQPTIILGNTRSAVQEKFCIFTIGMGNDVDYRLLERMALENCGMMRRIDEEANASAMLKGFYDEIGTPLLSDIRINYTEDAVRYVTQRLFTNYFNGSEIVVAGQLTDRASDSLHVQVTASNNDKNLVLEGDVPLRRRQQQTEKHIQAAKTSTAASSGPGVGQLLGGVLNSIAEDFVERVWGFLSVKDGIRGRLRSLTSKEREGHIQRSTNLSVNYRFLTPLTRMEVEKPVVLADGSMATPPPPGAEEDANELPRDEDDEEGREEELGNPGGQNAALRNTKGKSERRAIKKSITVSKTSADGDPHFVVEFPLSKLTVCFNINGEAGHVLRLVSDHSHSGVTVNGKLIGAPAPVGARKLQRTYFSAITVVVDRPRRAYIEVTPKRVILDGRDDRLVLPCHASAAVDSGELAVAVAAGANVTVTIGGGVAFVVLLHHYKNPAPYQTDHLGFYIANSKGLSQHCHGLIGQFLYEDVRLLEVPVDGVAASSAVLKVPVDGVAASSAVLKVPVDGVAASSAVLKVPVDGVAASSAVLKVPVDGVAASSAVLEVPVDGVAASSAVLRLKGRSVAVTRKSRRIYGGSQSVDCWFARNNAAKLIDGRYDDYLAAHMFDTGEGRSFQESNA